MFPPRELSDCSAVFEPTRSPSALLVSSFCCLCVKDNFKKWRTNLDKIFRVDRLVSKTNQLNSEHPFRLQSSFKAAEFSTLTHLEEGKVRRVGAIATPTCTACSGITRLLYNVCSLRMLLQLAISTHFVQKCERQNFLFPKS